MEHEPPARERAGVAIAVVAALALALSLACLCPTVAIIGDSPELVATAVEWGVNHAPGYPLHTAVGHLFARVPIGDVAARVNASSAVAHAGAVALVACAVLEIGGTRAGAIAAAGALALARSFFFASLYAEVFPLNDLLFAALLLVGLRATRRARAAEPALRPLAAMALLTGLASSNHHMIVLSAPALAVLAARPLRATLAPRPARLLPLTLLALAPFALLYGSVLVAAARAPIASWGDVHDLDSLVRLFLRRDYGGPFHASKHVVEGHVAERLGLYAHLVVRSFGPLALIASAAGLAVIARKRTTEAVALALAFLVPGPLFAVMNDLFARTSEEHFGLAERFVTMSHVPLAVLAGAGVSALLRVPKLRPIARVLAVAAPTALVVAAAPGAADASLRTDRRGDAFAEDLLAGAPDGALVLVSGDVYVHAALYACVVERRCGSRIVIAPGQLFLAWYAAQLARLYPDVALPPPELRGLRGTRWIIEHAIATRPVVAVPSLLAKAPDLAALPQLPSRLLVRFYPDTQARDADGPRFLDAARELAQGPSEACVGCALVSAPMVRPSFEVQVKWAYVAAFDAHADVARRAGDEALGVRLEAMARAMTPRPVMTRTLSASVDSP